jgi:hypothetical protein
MKMLASAPAVFAGLFLSSAVEAEEFRTVTDQNTFLDVVEGRKLTRLGIELDVLSNGQITGRAFGVPVSGAWRWQDGYFCRDLYYGERDLGPNCQVVKVNGNTVRFIADQGSGQYADLRLR